MTSRPAANNKKSTKPRGKPWPKGVSGNPAGRPSTGESWQELIKKIGDMTPAEAAKHCKAVAGQLASIGNGVTLKEAVIMRVYASLLFEPQPGLLNAFMDRTEGKIANKLEVYDWRKDAVEAGVDPDTLAAELFSKVALSDTADPDA